MTLNRFLTTLMQLVFGGIAIALWVLIIRDLLRERAQRRSQVTWLFPPHSETERLAAAHRLFDTDVDTVHSELDDVQINVDGVHNDVDGVQ